VRRDGELRWSRGEWRQDHEGRDDRGEAGERNAVPHRAGAYTAGSTEPFAGSRFRAVHTLRGAMNAVVAFAAALVSLRLAAELSRRARAGPAPELVAWAVSLGAYAVAAAALAAGAAGGWHNATFRAYYLFGGLLTAPLFGVGSLLRMRLRWATP